MDTSTTPKTATRQAALNGLAVVGFIVLIILGILAAVYAASFVPKALSRLASANVYLSSLVNPDDGQLEVVEQPSIPFEPAPVDPITVPIQPPVTPTTPLPTTPAPTTPATGGPQYTTPTYTVVPVPASTNYYGKADLTVTILETGYLNRSGDLSTFVRATSIPDNKDGAVRYQIANRGTNQSGSFMVEIRVKTDGGTDTDTVRGASLAPNRSIAGIAYFDAATSDEVEVRFTIDSDDDVDESNENNNSDSETIDIR